MRAPSYGASLEALLSCLLAALGFICFLPSLEGGFVFDDSEAVVKNKDIQPSSPLKNLFLNDFWGNKLTLNSSHKSYRPVTVISFRINVLLDGGELVPSNFHLMNLLLHGLASGLSVPVFKRLFRRKRTWGAPLIAAVLFTVHPIHSEAVAGIVGRADLLCAVFAFLSFLLYSGATESKSQAENVSLVLLSSVLIAFATFAKEQGITVLGICSAYDILLASNLFRQKHSFWFLEKSLVIRHVVLLLAGMGILYSRWWVMGFKTPTFQVVDNPASFAEGFFTRLLSYNYIYALNFWILLCPEWLCFDWSMGCIPLINLGDLRLILILMFWSFIGYLFWSALVQRSRHLLMSLACTLIPFSVAMNLFFRVGFVIAERVLYLPSVGFCMLVSSGLEKLFHGRKGLYVVLFALSCSNISRCIQRSREWQNEAELFASGLRVCPLNAKVHYNVAKTSKNPSIAEEHYREALRLHPKYEQAMNNLANLLRDQGNATEAEALLRRAIHLKPDFAAAWMNLGVVLSNLKRYNEALEDYKTALTHRPNYPDCYYNLGNLFLAQSMYNEAYSAWRVATNQNPTHAVAWTNMIVMLDSIGKLEDAKKMGEEALHHLPDEPSINFSFANTLGKLALYDEAETRFKKALQLRPNQAIYHTNLGVLYHRWEKYSLAEEQYQLALQINNNLPNVVQNLKGVKKLLKSKA